MLTSLEQDTVAGSKTFQASDVKHSYWIVLFETVSDKQTWVAVCTVSQTSVTRETGQLLGRFIGAKYQTL